MTSPTSTADADCDLPAALGRRRFSCTFTETISGDFGGPDHSNTVTASASDNDANSDTETATATVTFSDVLPDISVTKTAGPTSVARDRRQP